MEFWQSGLLLVVDELKHKAGSTQTRWLMWRDGGVCLLCDAWMKPAKTGSLPPCLPPHPHRILFPKCERDRRENETRGRELTAVGLGTKLTECEFHHLHHHHPHPHHPLSVPHGPWERRWRQEKGVGEGREKEGRIRTENRIGAYKEEIEGQGKQTKVTTRERREEEGEREGDLSEGLTLELWVDLKGLNRSKHRTKISTPQQNPLICRTPIII